MKPQDKFGRSEFGPVQILPPVEFDLSEGQALPANLGRGETPVTVLPSMVCDMGAAPTLVLELLVRPGMSGVSIGVDLFALWLAINEHERNLGGSGLTNCEPAQEQTSEGDVIRLVLTPSMRTGAEERLAELAAAINGAKARPAVLEKVLNNGAFAKRIASLQSAA